MTKQFKVGQVWADRKGRLREILIIDDTEYAILAKRVGVSRKDVFTIDGHLLNDREDPNDLITLIKDTEETVSKLDIGDRVEGTIIIVRTNPLGDVEYTVKLDSGETIEYTTKDLSAKRVKLESPLSSDDTVELQFGTTDSDGDFVFSKLDVLPPAPTPGQYYRTREGSRMMFIGKGFTSWVYQNESNTFTYAGPFKFACDSDNQDLDIIAPWTDPLPAVEIKRWAVVAVQDGGMSYRGKILAEFNSKPAAQAWSGASGVYLEIVELVGILPARDI
jgi:hypothetical protein